jgi:RND family efflux transporter MFP subunit
MSSRPLGILILALLAACSPPKPSAPPPPAVTVAAVAQEDITEWDEFTGRFEAVDAVEIRPRVSGYIRHVAFAEGREVRKGDVLFEIDPRPYQADVERAQAELEQARTTAALAGRDFERGQRLVQVQAISREEFDGRGTAAAHATAAVQVAEAALATAKLNLEWTTVRSPISGRVGRAEVTEGNLVQAGGVGTPALTTVVSLDPIYVSFESDEQSYLKYTALARSGSRPSGRTPVEMGLADEPGAYPYKGFINFVDNQLNPETGTIRFRAVFSNAERRFTPGLYARVKLMGSGRYRATLIQDRAIGTDQDKKFVMVLKADTTVEYRPVTLGRIVDGLRVVQAGLQPGEQIVISGLQRVRTGAKVAPQIEPMIAAVPATPKTSAPRATN